MKGFPAIGILWILALPLALAACGEDSPSGPSDDTAPAAVTDLASNGVTENSISLFWAATGDDGMTGDAAEYDLRYSTEPLTEDTWDDAVHSPALPPPSPPYTVESYELPGLSADMLYDMALKVADESSNWSGLSNVISVWTGGPTLHQITDNNESEFEPSWSPDGRWFAYESGPRDIWIVPAWGGSPVQLTDWAGWDGSPCWSPDGTMIAFYSDRSGGGDIHTISTAGGTATRITYHIALDRDPAWSPDGDWIAFGSARDGGTNDIWIIPAGGGTPWQFTNDATYSTYEPCWSPDSGWIAYIKNNQVWKKTITGGVDIQVTNVSGFVGNPSWSPDGTTIAFEHQPSGGNYDIWTVPAAGGTAVQFTTDEESDLEPSWRPDGARISFRSHRSGNRDIWTRKVE